MLSTCTGNLFLVISHQIISLFVHIKLLCVDATEREICLVRLVHQPEDWREHSLARHGLLPVQLCHFIGKERMLYGSRWRWNQACKQELPTGGLGLWASPLRGFTTSTRTEFHWLQQGDTEHEQQPLPRIGLVSLLQESEWRQYGCKSSCQNRSISSHLLPEGLWVQPSKCVAQSFPAWKLRQRPRIPR